MFLIYRFSYKQIEPFGRFEWHIIICSICVRCFVSKRTPLEHMMIPLLWLSISWGCPVFHRFANFLSKLVLNICQNFLVVCSIILAPLFYLDQIASNNHASPSNSLQGHSHRSLLVGLFWLLENIWFMYFCIGFFFVNIHM